MTEAALDRLRRNFPAESVLEDAFETSAYECDALSAYTCLPLAVLLPSSTEDVAMMLRICHEEGVRVTPRGAGTSLAGGALPVEESVVLCVSKMNQVLEANYATGQIRVQTGITNLGVSGAVAPEGWFYAPDPSSQLACTIAGNIAMNAGGAHCLKYGVTTNNLLGVRMVLMDGSIVDLGIGGLDDGNAGLLSLVCGSEGQFGIITEAVLKIRPQPAGARPLLAGFDSVEVAGACVADIISDGILPAAIEFMDNPCIRACEAHVGAGYPDVEALLIIEVEGTDADIDHQFALIQEIVDRHKPVEVRVSGSEEESARIWLGRKSAFGALGRIGDYICLDGTVPVAKLATVLKRIAELSTEYNLPVANVFHAGDGNMHPMIIFDANRDGDLQ
ncbi:MAG: FAD-binding protein, partial [Rhodobacteraceae bacterium]|nr:FAD-binding protein [Paracoccaceae bacterium]